VEGHEITYRRLEAGELGLLAEIDRTERIQNRYVQHGTRLEKQSCDWRSPPWERDGQGEHCVAHQRAECERHLVAGGVALGAFAGERFVGIGLVRPQLRAGVAQLAFLHVSDGRRGLGIGGWLARELEQIAREAGHRAMVVSATPSANTVEFYLHLGYEPLAEPLPELFELEPEDIHLQKVFPSARH